MSCLAPRAAVMVVSAFALVAVGCVASDEPDAGDAPAATATADGWLGRWNGPEGTFLLLERSGDQYRVTVQNLDGPRTFEAIAVAGGLQFERDGVVESPYATNGADTGMKWLADKSDCLTVRPGEGYCRDR